MPVGYVLATTPAQAAARLPPVLGLGNDPGNRVAGAETQLRNQTIMVAFHPPQGAVADNVGLIKLPHQAPADPAEIQSPAFQSEVRATLAKVKASDIRFTSTRIGGQPAEQIDYTIPTSGGGSVFGRQFYLAERQDVFVLTVTAGTRARASAAGNFIVASWRVG